MFINYFDNSAFCWCGTGVKEEREGNGFFLRKRSPHSQRGTRKSRIPRWEETAGFLWSSSGSIASPPCRDGYRPHSRLPSLRTLLLPASRARPEVRSLPAAGTPSPTGRIPSLLRCRCLWRLLLPHQAPTMKRIHGWRRGRARAAGRAASTPGGRRRQAPLSASKAGAPWAPPIDLVVGGWRACRERTEQGPPSSTPPSMDATSSCGRGHLTRQGWGQTDPWAPRLPKLGPCQSAS
jgi:hypothetical protein